MYKKAWCTCKDVILLIKPIVFLTFSLPSAWLDLKVPNDDNDDDDVDNDYGNGDGDGDGGGNNNDDDDNNHDGDND